MPPSPRSSVSARRTTVRMSSSPCALQGEQQRTGEQRADDREERVLGCRADEADPAVLHRGQQGVLLCLAEAVDLVDEQQGVHPAHAELASGLVDAARMSLTPEVTADSSTKRRRVARLTTVASVVFPVPGGPHSSSAMGASSSTSRRSGLPSPSRCRCPTTSSRVRGRIRTASGSWDRWASAPASSNSVSDTVSA